jgi:deoxyribodipyrimidine photo-lyase
MRGLHWFRADLRLTDNTALRQAISASEELITCFIITTKTWERHDMASTKIQFMLNNLQSLSNSLAEKGILLLIRNTDYFSECPKIIQEICHQYRIDALYFNRQYEIDETKRDIKVKNTLLSNKIEVHAYDDQLVMPPDSILNQQGGPLKIFTPFKKNWIGKVACLEAWKTTSITYKKFPKKIKSEIISEISVSPEAKAILNLWPAGETVAKQKLTEFCETKIDRYHIDRDYPCLDGTSRLSPYLALGVLSPRQCIEAVMQKLEIGSLEKIKDFPGSETWVSELIWREFYKHIMYHFPKICCGKPFRAETDHIHWSNHLKNFDSWCTGHTGFPLIDAAMRQLNQTGWMHNRLRMVVANFLTKAMFLDWRLGERYFIQHLLDGDLAANNGGWQWSASTGTDAVPYFRIFNPTLQSERFDPNGKFIRQYCPELLKFDKKTIHDPHGRAPELAKKQGYSLPIVDFKSSRQLVMDSFKKLSHSQEQI